MIGIRAWFVVLGVATVLAACRKSDDASGSSEPAKSKGGEEQAPATPKLEVKSIELGRMTLRLSVPAEWDEQVDSGRFPRAFYRGPDFRSGFELKTTCAGVCEPAQWTENVRAEAKERLASFGDPERYQPAADVEVIRNEEPAPGHHVLWVKATPKDPSAGGSVAVIAEVRRFEADWPEILVCTLEIDAKNEAWVQPFIDACRAVEVTVAPPAAE